MSEKILSNIEVDIDEMNDNEETYVDEQAFRIRYWNVIYTFSRLSDWMNEGKINVPDLQRGFVWTPEMASRLIDSILLGLPLPTFFFYQNDDDNERVDIIDGLQRLTAIKCFINGEKLPGEKQIFRLSNINSINKTWRNKIFKELTQSQRNKIMDSDASCIFFEQRYPSIIKKDIKRYVFERLNTGGVKLSSQEIRNAVFPGKLLNKIKILSSEWNDLEVNFSEVDYKRYKVDEVILRILAVYDISKNNSKCFKRNQNGEIERVMIKSSINLKNQMDFFLEKYQDFESEHSLIFSKALEIYYHSINKSKNYNFLAKNIDSSSINIVLVESIFVSIMLDIDSNTTEYLSEINLVDNFRYLHLREDLMDPFIKRTTNIGNISRRIEIMRDVLKRSDFCQGITNEKI